MPTDPSDRQLAISLRLKAARFLAGRRNDDGRAVAVTVPELARHPLLVANRITRNRLEDYEQMTAGDPRPMELSVIAEALGVPPGFLLGEPGGSDEKVDAILAAVLDMQEKLNQRYDQLGEIVRERQEMERRIRHMTAEEADEVVRMLGEARMRLGRDIGRRGLPAGRATGHPAATGEGGA